MDTRAWLQSHPLNHVGVHRDNLDTTIEWDGGEINGAVTLRITLKNASLYALWSD